MTAAAGPAAGLPPAPSTSAGPASDIADVEGVRDVERLARGLVRFDTANPPGGTRECVLALRDLLSARGVETTLRGRDPERPSLVARVPGRGEAEPLLLHAHVDVVPVDTQDWSHPPFGADVEDGVLWGRGAVDMKGQLAMMVAALLELGRRGERPAGDVVLAVVPDEESGGPAGAHELVAEHAELFAGVRHAIGEDGGAFVDLGTGPPVHPVVVAEKRACWMRLALRGPGGHASRIAVEDTAGAALGRTLDALGGGGLERHVTPAARLMVERLAEGVAPEVAAALRAHVADGPAPVPGGVLPPAAEAYLRTVTHHTAVPTAIAAPSATNVRPSAIELDVDGRLLPGAGGTADMLALLDRRLAAHGVTDYDVSVLVEGEPLPEPDLGPFYRRLAAVAGRTEPDAVAIPMITTASTDARLFAGLGIRCYGWFPAPGCGAERVRLHQPDERLPVSALPVGAEAYRELLGGAP